MTALLPSRLHRRTLPSCSFAIALVLSTSIAANSAAADVPSVSFPGKQSEWNGFRRYDFEVDGKPVLVVAPEQPAAGRPWVWHGEFFGHKPAPDIALLKRGFHVVYMRVPDMLGAPSAVAPWNAFYEELTEKYGFAKKVALVGLSRGGLYCYNWAAANPEKVACIYGDAPVCDFKSWPGGKGKGKGSPRDWKSVLERYGFADDAAAIAYTKNPVDNLTPLAAAKVPLLHVYGDADDVVPWEENTGLLADRYRKLGGSITLIAKPGVGHHPHGLDDPTPIVEFIAEHAETGNAKIPPATETDSRLHADGKGWRLDKAIITDPNRPRVLLIGDSILNGYLKQVVAALEGKAFVDAWVNPYCQSEHLNKLLAEVLANGPYDVVHFNMGLHGWQEGRIKPGTFEPLTKAYVEVLKAKLPQGKFIWAASTPVTMKDRPADLDSEINPVIVEHNRMAAHVMAEMNVPINDLYSLLADKRELARGDRFHWTPPAYKILADETVRSILQALAPNSQ